MLRVHYHFLMKLCTVDGCTKERGKKEGRHCPMHSARMRRRGTTDPAGRRPNGTAVARDEAGRKRCVRCAQWLPEGEFYAHAGASDGLRTECRVCQIARGYSLSRNDVDRMREEQGNVCPVCLGELGGRYAIDHDHACCTARPSCGKCVRRLLCIPCNRGIGMLRDDPAILERGRDYLLRYSTSPLSAMNDRPVPLPRSASQ